MAGSKAQPIGEAEKEKGPSTPPQGYNAPVSTKLHLLNVFPPPKASRWELTLPQMDLCGGI